MKKTMIIAAMFAAFGAYAGDNVPGNCGKGSGHGNGCENGKTINNARSNSKSVSNSVGFGVGVNGGNANSSSTGGSVGTVRSQAVGNVSTTIDNPRQVFTAIAPALTTANGTCMGSTSAGGQGVGFGLSFGTTWSDESCDRRYDANTLASLGKTDAALAIMCQKPSVAVAMAAAGTPCPERKNNVVVMPEHTDPYVRARLGLPALAQ